MKRTIHNLQTGEITVVDMTADEVAAKQAKQVEYDKVKYKKDRAASYPSIADQLDKIYHSGIDAWKADIKKVKEDNPKP